MFIKGECKMFNEIKTRFIIKILSISIIFISSALAQQFSAVNIKGDVKYQTATSENWNILKDGFSLETTDFVTTSEKSSVQIKRAGQMFNLGELSAVALSSIKPMSTDELLLALAMEDMINAPKTNGKNNSSSTAVYGDKEEEGKNLDLKENNFGVKRLNGAVQLAKSGFKESAIVFAKETYRKYPDSKQIPAFRIFFADLLHEKELYEEALREYMDINKLELTNEEKIGVANKINSINKILLND
jgi:hypothetical protein